MTYRTAADLLEQMFPVDAAKHPETFRRHALRVGEALGEGAAARPEVTAPAVVVTLDSTFIRSCEKAERHLEVRVGNVETKFGGRQVFGAVAKAESDLKVLINRNLDAAGRTEHTALPRSPTVVRDFGAFSPTPALPRHRFSIGSTLE